MIQELTVDNPKIFFKYATGAFKDYLSKIFELTDEELSDIGQLFTVNFQQKNKEFVLMISTCLEDVNTKNKEFIACVNGNSYLFKKELAYDRNIIPLMFEERDKVFSFALTREIRIFEVERISKESPSFFYSLVNNVDNFLTKLSSNHKNYESLITSRSCISVEVKKEINCEKYEISKKIIELEEMLENSFLDFQRKYLLK